MLLEHYQADNNILKAWGRQGVVEISSPLPGVLRVRHSPAAAAVELNHPLLSEKSSFAVLEQQRLPLEIERRKDRAYVAAPEVTLALSLVDGSFALSDRSGRLLAESREVSTKVEPGYPSARYLSKLVLNSPAEEAYLGFGGKVGPLDRRGMHLTFWSSDASPQTPDTDPLHLCIPFFIGLLDGVAWGALLDETWRSEIDVALQDPTRLVLESRGPEIDIYLMVGPSPADVVRRYAELTGKPPLPPLFSLGALQSRWGYGSAPEILSVIEGYRARQLPLDGVFVDVDAMDGFRAFTWDAARFPDPKALIQQASERGVHVVAVTSPAIKKEVGYAVYDEAVRRRFLVRHAHGEPLVGEAFAVPAVFPDLTRPEVGEWWSGQCRLLAECGLAGLVANHNEPLCLHVEPSPGGYDPNKRRQEKHAETLGTTLPDNAVHGAKTHLEVHNVYGHSMARATQRALVEANPGKRPFVMTRAGFAGVQRYAAVWTGDNASHWSHLEASIPMLQSLGLCALSFAGADVGGFVGTPTGELLARWYQLATFYPLMRNHSGKLSGHQEPWRFDEPYLSAIRAALERRYRLLPTLYTLLYESATTGLPVLRPLLLDSPNDRDAVNAFDQFQFGADLLVAPIVRPGQTRRLAYLPAGSWLEFTNLEPPGAVIEGERYVVVEGPLDTVPIWLRGGSAIALTAPSLHTSTANWPNLEWHVHAGATVRGRLYEDEGDGHGPFGLTELTGGRSSRTFWLEQRARGELTRQRTHESLRVYGLPDVANVEGAEEWSFEDGLLEIRVEASWRRIEIEAPEVS